MKRRSLFVVTSFTLLLTGVVLAHTASSRRSVTVGSVQPSRLFTGEAAIRYRQGQPTHWRACLLQP